MRLAVFGDAHAHAEALEAVIAAAERAGVDGLWSLGDMIGGGPDPAHVVARTRERCHVALMGNHDYGGDGVGRAVAVRSRSRPRSIELARASLAEDDLAWMRSRSPAARREGVQCWHGGPRNPVQEYVGPSNAAACLAVQSADLGLVAHTHIAAACARPHPTRRGSASASRWTSSGGKWLLNPGAVGAPVAAAARLVGGLDAEAADGAFWLAARPAARPRPGAARRTTRARPADAPARSASTTPRSCCGRSACGR